jgi:hypothetical protein
MWSLAGPVTASGQLALKWAVAMAETLLLGGFVKPGDRRFPLPIKYLTRA